MKDARREACVSDGKFFGVSAREVCRPFWRPRQLVSCDIALNAIGIYGYAVTDCTCSAGIACRRYIDRGVSKFIEPRVKQPNARTHSELGQRLHLAFEISAVN